MLFEFLKAHRDELIRRCRGRVLERRVPTATSDEMTHGIPLFLQQLTRTLDAEQRNNPSSAHAISGSPGAEGSSRSEMGREAGHHGRELLTHGFTVDQVVHDYGDLCQAITELAIETGAPIGTHEFKTSTAASTTRSPTR